MNVISLYFALWVTVDKGGQDIFYSAAISLSMLAVALSVPVFGAISDNTGKRQGPLTVLTLLCVICTALIGEVDNLWALKGSERANAHCKYFEECKPEDKIK